MEVRVAKSAGFCFGVKRAVDSVYEQIEINKDKNVDIYTYGPIIHNEEVVKDLESKGVKVIESSEELKSIKEGIVIIRSHGTSGDIYKIIEDNKLKLVDATCPFVKKIHNIVNKESKDGSFIVIIGNSEHPEVIGIKGWAVDPENVVVVGNEEDADKLKLPSDKRICVVSQTTFNSNKFNYLVEIIRKKGYDINVLDTICNATHVRQSETKEIAKNASVMLVIGGKKSSNTQKLYEICKKECNNTYYIQTINDLDLEKVKSQVDSGSYVGITAGASTPNNIIEEVHTDVSREF